MPGGGRGVSWLLLPPKPDKPLKNHCKQAVQRWSSGQAQDRRFLGMDGVLSVTVVTPILEDCGRWRDLVRRHV
jgi:hypothetical protein